MDANDPTRRAFLKALGLGALAMSLPACESNTKPSGTPSTQPSMASAPAQVGLQLWTVRAAMEQDIHGTLERVAEIGFSGVETAFWPEDVTHAEAGALLENVGLPVFAVHAELPLGDNRAVMLEMADAYQCDRMVWHGWPEDQRYQTLEGIKQLADVYNEAYAFAQTNGLRFGLHNHWWEFQEIEEGGYPFYLLKEMIEPGIFFEIDTYWTRVAGLDPATVVGDFGDRVPLLHIKDGDATSTEGPMVAVGQGILDFPAIVAAAQGATEWMIVEIDAAETDMLDAVEQSYTYLTTNGLAV